MRLRIHRLLLAVTVLITFQAMAHHSAVVFDVTQTMVKTGKVTLFTLRNPHLILNMEVTNEHLTCDAVDRNWQGESIGHWEGDTLVVETTGFIGTNRLIQAGVPSGEQFRMVERISLINDGNTMVSEYTFTDPEYWVGEWKHVKFRDRVLRTDVREANCIYEDNFALPGMD
jgi:hypothetical protein